MSQNVTAVQIIPNFPYGPDTPMGATCPGHERLGGRNCRCMLGVGRTGRLVIPVHPVHLCTRRKKLLP